MRSLFSTKSLTLLLGVSLCGITGYMLYIFLKRDDDDYIDGTIPQGTQFKSSEFRVPKECVRIIIGRKGQKIRQIQDETNTKVDFKDISNNDRETMCVVRGTMEACYKAEHLIEELIATQPILEYFEMFVPQASVGKIIGRCGEVITEIGNLTGAKINVDDGDRSMPTRKVVIKGTSDQIRLAKSYIDEIIENFERTKAKMQATLAKREPRLPLKHHDNAKSPAGSPKVERMSPIPGQSENPFEVYVSAMIDPSRFWVQIVGQKATELDLLVEEMTEYYKKEENKELHTLQKVQIGDLVAATFPYDNKWYRAEVLNLDVNTSHAELYYVDYGDTDSLQCKDLYELRTDFLRLHFQAIECFLARVEPVGNVWSEEAIDKFEEWTHVAQWQKLSAKINGYHIREKTRAKREGSPVPGVDLFDVTNDTDVDIANELVKNGLALLKKDSARSSRATSVSNISVESS